MSYVKNKNVIECKYPEWWIRKKKSKEEVLFETEVWKRLRDEDLTGSKPCIICCTVI